MPNDAPAPRPPSITSLEDLPSELRAWRGLMTKGWSASQASWPANSTSMFGWGGLRSLLDPAEIEPENRRRPKDGPCFIPGVLTPRAAGSNAAERHKTRVSQISVLVFDLDRGCSFTSVKARLRRAGVAALAAPTFNHLNRACAFKVLPARWEQYLAALGSPEAVALNWCARQFTPTLLTGGLQELPTITGSSSGRGKPVVKVEFRLAQPRPRWRVVLPLATPWIPADGAGDAAAARWAKLYIESAEALGLWDADPSCADASRLYYTARWPAAWPVEGPWDLPLARMANRGRRTAWRPSWDR
jgi:hypothetical protein